jgi:hypothetical protein
MQIAIVDKTGHETMMRDKPDETPLDFSKRVAAVVGLLLEDERRAERQASPTDQIDVKPEHDLDVPA